MRTRNSYQTGPNRLLSFMVFNTLCSRGLLKGYNAVSPFSNQKQKALYGCSNPAVLCEILCGMG
jgi:hypothetical protein